MELLKQGERAEESRSLATPVSFELLALGFSPASIRDTLEDDVLSEFYD